MPQLALAVLLGMCLDSLVEKGKHAAAECNSDTSLLSTCIKLGGSSPQLVRPTHIVPGSFQI